jgi:hypothetical protein
VSYFTAADSSLLCMRCALVGSRSATVDVLPVLKPLSTVTLVDYANTARPVLWRGQLAVQLGKCGSECPLASHTCQQDGFHDGMCTCDHLPQFSNN